jgi:hypothetical protein
MSSRLIFCKGKISLIENVLNYTWYRLYFLAEVIDNDLTHHLVESIEIDSKPRTLFHPLYRGRQTNGRSNKT